MLVPVLDVTRLRVLAAVARHGSVTAAAQQLRYSQPAVSHHLARLEAETGARLVQRVGRGVRLTEAGRRLAERAEEILGRLETAEAELAAHSGLRAGRVRLAAFPSGLATLVPPAAASFTADHPDVELGFVEAEPPQALHLLRAGTVDVALVFDYPDDSGTEDGTLRRTPLLTEPLYLVTPAGRARRLAAYADADWIGGCDRCRSHLVRRCAAAGFTPRIAFTTDDYVAVQALVAAGLGVTILPQLALWAHRAPHLRVTRLAGAGRDVWVARYGSPPDPPATTALVTHLARVAGSVPTSSAHAGSAHGTAART
jgi:molybdate transport repressor ModE-like protein